MRRWLGYDAKWGGGRRCILHFVAETVHARVINYERMHVELSRAAAAHCTGGSGFPVNEMNHGKYASLPRVFLPRCTRGCV